MRTSWKWLAPAKSEGRRGEGPKTRVENRGPKTGVQKPGSKTVGLKTEGSVVLCFLVLVQRMRPDGPPPLTFKSYSFFLVRGKCCQGLGEFCKVWSISSSGSVQA